MRRKSLLGVSAALAAVAAFFFQPRKGAERREAVRRGGERLVHRGTGITSLVGSRRRGDGGTAALRHHIEDGLIDALGADALAIRVTAAADTVTVRGEVASLEQISQVSAVIERLRGDADVVNLVRLRAAAEGAWPGAGE
ncbi:MAG TPA: BON domain-containing protein [Candidatus Binatia bacterium]|nr:BON domain-containing protein [Candidatus Binatia bacterium]